MNQNRMYEDSIVLSFRKLFEIACAMCVRHCVSSCKYRLWVLPQRMNEFSLKADEALLISICTRRVLILFIFVVIFASSFNLRCPFFASMSNLAIDIFDLRECNGSTSINRYYTINNSDRLSKVESFQTTKIY